MRSESAGQGSVQELVEEGVVTAYWMPGCSACLRMKEFIEKSGRDFVAINVDEHREHRAELAEHGMTLPTARLGDRWVSGQDLALVADLIDLEYHPPVILPKEELVERYRHNFEAGHRMILQLSDEMLAHELPGRKRPMLEVADQVAVVIRAFLYQYEHDEHTTKYYRMPERVHTKQQVLDRLEETRRRFDAWWEEDGIDDELDRVTVTPWGYPTMLEMLEKETWHTTQHVRQLQYVLREEFGVEPELPLTDADLAGLPLPERIHD